MGIKDVLKKHKDSIKEYAVEFTVSALISLVKKLLNRRKDRKEILKPLLETPNNELESTETPDDAPEATPHEESPRNVVWVQSPHYSARPAGKAITAIILHHTGAMTAKSTLSWFQAPESKVSAHYVIDRNGDLYQMVKEENKSWHSGKSELHGQSDVNSFSIGIELVGDGKAEFPKAQYEALAWLVKTLKKKYNVEDSSIVGHKDIAPGRKVDPEPFNWDLFWSLVRTQ
jgi:N-acetylmuramoyl-L-alanine amidase